MTTFGMLPMQQTTWAGLKELLARKSMALQCDLSDPSIYQLFAFDTAHIVYQCLIYRTDLGLAGFDVSQNAADLVDFEDNWRASVNASIEPRTSDGKTIVLPNLFPGNVVLYLPGVSDNIATGKLGDAEDLGCETCEFEILGGGVDQTKNIQFIEPVYMAGGYIEWEGGSKGSWLKYEAVAPSSMPAVTVADPPDTGNYNLSDASGALPAAILIVPAAPGTGTYNVDLTAKFNANVRFTKVVPVPVQDDENPNGFFDWNDDTEIVSLNAGQVGHFNLFVVDITLGRFLPGMRLRRASSERQFYFSSIKPKKILAHWLHRVKLHNASPLSTLGLSFDLYTARRNTTP
jgi:hypothetical protein